MNKPLLNLVCELRLFCIVVSINYSVQVFSIHCKFQKSLLTGRIERICDALACLVSGTTVHRGNGWGLSGKTFISLPLNFKIADGDPISKQCT